MMMNGRFRVITSRMIAYRREVDRNVEEQRAVIAASLIQDISSSNTPIIEH